MKYKTDFTHNLIVPKEYGITVGDKSGSIAKASRIFVKAPGNTQLADLSALEQAQNEALVNASLKFKDMARDGAAKPQTLDKITDEDAEQHVMLLSGNGMKLGAAFESLRLLITDPRNPALLDGREPLTPTLFDEMTPVDTRVLLGKYLLNFLNFSRAA